MIGLISQKRRLKQSGWESFVNFGQTGDGTDISGWNNIKAADLSSGGSFTGLLDTDGTPRIS